MNNLHPNQKFDKTFSVGVLIAFFYLTSVASNTSQAYAQDTSTNPPAPNSDPIDDTNSGVSTNDLQTQSFPGFKWPWSTDDNGKILWTSGPHSWSKGGQLTAKISASRGSGLDFAKSDGTSFDVLAMASGTVIKNECGFIGLGCIVAIRHDVGGSVMIYAHLVPNGAGTAPSNSIQVGIWYPQRTIVGNAGQSGGQAHVHLHIEFRDGAAVCSAQEDCGDIGFSGNPVGWDGRRLVDDYYVSGYFDSENFCGPGADCDTIFNYDGSAVRGSIAAPIVKFPYIDAGINRHVEAFVHPNFSCDLNSVNCEINATDGTTVFADQGKFSGGGGILYSTNSRLSPVTPTPPSPADGIELCDNANYGAPCAAYVYTNNDTCINLASSGMDDKAESLRFRGNYIGNYDAVLYADNSCSVYNARYGSDATSLGGLNNQISSFRIEQHGAPPGAGDGIELCDGTNYGTPCTTLIYTSDNTCINLASTGWDNRAESLRFHGTYSGNYDAILYDDTGCSVYNARYGSDTSTLAAFNNSISSLRIEKHSPPKPELAPNPLDGRADPIIISSVPGTSTNNTLYAGQPIYIDWGYKNTGQSNAGAHHVKLWIDGQLIIDYPFNGLGAGNLGGFDDWLETWSSPGTHTVTLTVDANNEIDEGDEGNNSWSKQFTWAPVCYTLSVSAIPAESGTVPLSPPSNCAGGAYTEGTVVQLNAIANADYSFNNWSGDAVGSTTLVSVAMNMNRAVTANFMHICQNCGLANSPWPMALYNARHTGQSPNVGPVSPVLKWSYLTGSSLGSAAISADNTVFIGSGDGYLYAFQPNGTLKWQFNTGQPISSTPAVAIDGTIYFSAGSISASNGYLYALKPDGTLKWRFDFGANPWSWSSPAVSSDGIIYVGSGINLYALWPDGSLKWQHSQDDTSSPAIAPDGTIYGVGDVPNMHLYALNPDGSEKWRYVLPGNFNFGSRFPSIAADGTIYIGRSDNKLYAIHPNGTLAWTYTTDGDINAPVAISNDGTVYLNSEDGYLYALQPNGMLKWRTNTGRSFAAPTVDSHGRVFVTSESNYTLYSIGANGNVIWYLNLNDDYSGTTPTIGSNGLIYIGGRYNHISAIASTIRGVPRSDFDGDGYSDPALYYNNGVWAWLTSSSNFASIVTSPAFDTGGGATPFLGNDFDGDGKTDPAVYHPDWGLLDWRRSSDNATSQFGYFTSTAHPVAISANDYDGDGKTDPALFYPINGVWSWKNSSNTSDGLAAFNPAGNPTPIPNADLNGDGKSDPALYYSGTGVFAWNTSGTVGTAAFSAAGNPLPFLADFDGDGKSDPALYYQTWALWAWKRSTDGVMTTAAFNPNGSPQPIMGYFDSDNKADAGLYYADYGLWAWKRSTDGQIGIAAYNPGGSPEPQLGNDFDGDGKSDPALYYRTWGLWAWKESSTGTDKTAAYNPGGNPVAVGGLDFDGDGKAEPALYHRDWGLWVWKRSSDGTIVTKNMSPNNAPLPVR